MNKYSKYLFLLFLALSLYCCNSTDIPSKHENTVIYKDLDSIVSDGKLRALVNYGHTSYFIYKGNPMGFEYELLKKYAQHLGVELEVIPISNMDSIFVFLNQGDADIVAANLTITQERLQEINFTEPVLITKQVLVQRKPENWRSLSKKKLADSLLHSPLDLANKTIHVRKGSSFFPRLKSLSNEIGAPINIKTVSGETTMELLIEDVANKRIDYTIADKNIALVSQWQYPGIDASLVISLDQKIAWATRNNSDSLTQSINNWLSDYQKTRQFKMLYSKYFKNEKSFIKRVSHKYYTLESGQISPYDELIKKHASRIHWDWELLAALIYQESHFNNETIGWGGSFGLMQFMPNTGAKYGVDTNSSAEANIIAGTKYLQKLDNMWKPHVSDSVERVKFVLASYNVGPGHVFDAQRLARKYSEDPELWKNVGFYLKNKSNPKYYRDSEVKHGYCKGYITYEYVSEIMERYDHYKNMTVENQLAEN
ncbi:MAG: transporter substrate-binding domain-containing protein [Flavobacteriales bacterium]|nr:transporter substrate-binding domain-containing protein [Flavobacteriales bacterium]